MLRISIPVINCFEVGLNFIFIVLELFGQDFAKTMPLDSRL